MKKILKFLLLGILFFTPVYAEDKTSVVAGISKNASAAEFVIYFFNLAIAAGTFIAAVMLAIAGFNYISSRGDPSKIEEAKKNIRNTFLGLIVLMSSLIILNIINPSLTTIKINNLSEEEQQNISVPGIKEIGVYLYKNDGSYLALEKTISSLVQDNFQKQVTSVKFVNPDSYKYGAVLFTEGDLRGNCSYALSDINDLGTSSGSENAPPIGNNTLSSVYIFKALEGFPTIRLYNTIDCKKRSDEYGAVSEASSVCTVIGRTGFENIQEACPDFRDTVLSIEATTDTGVLLKAADKNGAGRCQFFTTGTSECINVIKNSYVYDHDQTSSIKPLSFMLFPLYVK